MCAGVRWLPLARVKRMKEMEERGKRWGFADSDEAEGAGFKEMSG